MVSTPPTLGAGQREKKLGMREVAIAKEGCLAGGGKPYTESPMVCTGGSQPLVNPWVSVVPSPVCKPLVTVAGARALATDPVEEFAFCFHDSGRPLARH